MAKNSRRQRFKNLSEDESGSTLVETVVSIPLIALLFGLILASVGVSIVLMGQVTAGAGAARTASHVMDELSTANNCVEVDAITADYSDPSNRKYITNFDSYTCVDGESFPIALEVEKSEGSRVFYSKTLTIMVN